MGICVIYSAAEREGAERTGFLRGRLSYMAREGSLFCEKLLPEDGGDVMVVSANTACEYAAAPICGECRRRGYSSVFLDAEKAELRSRRDFSLLAASLGRSCGKVYVPRFIARSCDGAHSVAVCSVSCGSLEDYIKRLKRESPKLALSIQRTAAKYSLDGSRMLSPLSQKELSLLIAERQPSIFFSEHLMTNYFICRDKCSDAFFVMFDNARSLSGKIALARSLGVDDIFILYREIADIADEIGY